jgi:hypothetical protein
MKEKAALHPTYAAPGSYPRGDDIFFHPRVMPNTAANKVTKLSATRWVDNPVREGCGRGAPVTTAATPLVTVMLSVN